MPTRNKRSSHLRFSKQVVGFGVRASAGRVAANASSFPLFDPVRERELECMTCSSLRVLTASSHRAAPARGGENARGPSLKPASRSRSRPRHPTKSNWASITAELCMMILFHPLLRDTVARMVKGAVALGRH